MSSCFRMILEQGLQTLMPTWNWAGNVKSVKWATCFPHYLWQMWSNFYVPTFNRNMDKIKRKDKHFLWEKQQHKENENGNDPLVSVSGGNKECQANGKAWALLPKQVLYGASRIVFIWDGEPSVSGSSDVIICTKIKIHIKLFLCQWHYIFWKTRGGPTFAGWTRILDGFHLGLGCNATCF